MKSANATIQCIIDVIWKIPTANSGEGEKKVPQARCYNILIRIKESHVSFKVNYGSPLLYFSISSTLRTDK